MTIFEGYGDLRNRPYALVEAKLSEEKPNPSLLYFAARLKAKHTLQLVRNSNKKKMTAEGILILPAAEFLSLI